MFHPLSPSPKRVKDDHCKNEGVPDPTHEVSDISVVVVDVHHAVVTTTPNFTFPGNLQVGNL